MHVETIEFGPADSSAERLAEAIWERHQLVANVEPLFAAVDRLREYPLSGRVVPELQQATLREVVDAPYRIVYRVRAEVLEVITVVHAARQFPADALREPR